MSESLTVTFAHVAHVCNRLQKIAAQSYVRADDGHHDVKLNLSDAPRSTSFEDIYESHTRGRRRLDPALESELYNNGFYEFSAFGFGTNTWVYAGHHANGHDYAIRASFNTFDQRSLTPLMVQPYHQHRQLGLIAEVEPLIQILTLEDSSVPQSQAVHALDETETFILDTLIRTFMRAASCHAREAPCKDMGVLPDGTPIQPDPGQIQYPQGVDVAHAIDLFSTVRNPLPYDQLQWICDKRRFKQDLFFINPFDRPAVYQGFALA